MNVAHKKSLVVVGVRTSNTTEEKQIPLHCAESCSLLELIYNMQNWNFNMCIIFLYITENASFYTAVIVFHIKWFSLIMLITGLQTIGYSHSVRVCTVRKIGLIFIPTIVGAS